MGRASEALGQLESVKTGACNFLMLRKEYLQAALRSLSGWIEIYMLKKYRSFDEEAVRIYGATAPPLPRDFVRQLHCRMHRVVPEGSGTLSERVMRYRDKFLLSGESVVNVCNAVLTEARRRTEANVRFVDNGVRVEYAPHQDETWSGYSRYLGNGRSLISINQYVPVWLHRAVILITHEGYPGHHFHNTLLDASMYQQAGLPEFSCFPLQCPMSLVQEGIATLSTDMVFPGQERLRFDKEVLFPLAGLDPTEADRYYAFYRLMPETGYIICDPARQFLDGLLSREAAAYQLVRDAFLPPEVAEREVNSFGRYRSHRVLYELGTDVLKGWIERRGGSEDHPAHRWALFSEIASSMRLLTMYRENQPKGDSRGIQKRLGYTCRYVFPGAFSINTPCIKQSLNVLTIYTILFNLCLVKL